MKHRIYVRDLECFKLASQTQRQNKLVSPTRYFDLEKLPTEGLKKEFRQFIIYRGQQLKLGSIRSEFWPYHVLCRFFSTSKIHTESLLEEKQEVILWELKKWMLKNGYRVTKQHYRREFDRTNSCCSDVILYLRRMYVYLLPKEEKPETERDIWRLEHLNFPVRINPIHTQLTLNFTQIRQDKMRKECKKACEVSLHYLAVSTVAGQITAVKRLSLFLTEKFPDTSSFLQFDREQLEEYLIFLNTEVEGKKSFRSELQSLKSLISTVGKIYEWKVLEQLFLPDDIPRGNSSPAYRAYTDNEIERLNQAIVRMDEQIARALILHQMLGNRISETLTLKKDCLVKRGGHWMVRIFQQKTQKTCYKPANADVIQLIQRSIAYTERKYKDTDYIFVYDKNEKEPMRYERVQYQVMAMIREQNLRDDHGILFGVGTHTFRHSYGKRLTEMHVNDATIAKLLGHTNTNTVRHYRKFGDQALASETREVRNSMNRILAQITEEWKS